MGKDKDGWCDFHQAFGHITKDCWALKMQIEKLVQAGHLNRYVRRSPDKRRKSRGNSRGRSVGTNKRERSRSLQRTPTHQGTIATIFGGRMTVHPPNFEQEARRIEEERKVGRVLTVLMGANMTPLGRKEPTPTIIFDNRDLKCGASRRDELMVISVLAAKYKIERVLIDQGSSANILYWSTVQKMQLPMGWLQECSRNLYGFVGECVPIRGMVKLETSFGKRSSVKTIPVLYTIVDVEVYVDDMVGVTEHYQALGRVFHILRKHRLRLNPNKCSFGV
ncbi:hypothetical protein CR513_23907, partial [Mucuna pruriens]